MGDDGCRRGVVSTFPGLFIGSVFEAFIRQLYTTRILAFNCENQDFELLSHQVKMDELLLLNSVNMDWSAALCFPTPDLVSTLWIV